MSTIEKYENIHQELPNLQDVLQEAIQSDFLEIKKVERDCDKYGEACEKHPGLKDAMYVIFSKYVKKAEHNQESFVFVDHTGKQVALVPGKDMALYGLLGSCFNLDLSKEYIEEIEASHHDH